MNWLFLRFAIVYFAFLPALVQAGSSEATKAILPTAQVAKFADRVQHDLAARGARVAIVARIGRDPRVLPSGVDYTHVSFWVYSHIKLANGQSGQGYQVYNLYQASDNKARSILVQDRPADFFAGAHSLDAGIIIPDVRLQKKLLSVISSPTYRALHNRKYTVLSNPNTTQFQNCTEHTLDVIMASVYGTSDTRQIKANIAAHFQPQSIKLSGLKRALAPVASSALSTADHKGRVETATFGSIARFMETHDLQSAIYRVTPERVAKF